MVDSPLTSTGTEMKFYKSLQTSSRDEQTLKLQLINDSAFPKFWRNGILAHMIKQTTDKGILWRLFSSGTGRDLDKSIIFKFIKDGFPLDKYKVMEAFLAFDGDAMLERLTFLCQLAKSGHRPSKDFVELIVQEQNGLLLEIQREDIYFEPLEKFLTQRGRFTQVVDKIIQLRIKEGITCLAGIANKESVLAKFTEAEKSMKAIQQVEPQVQAIINNQRFKVFRRINTTELRSNFEKYYKKSILKMRDLKLLKQSTEPLTSLLRATELLNMGDLYEARLEQTCDELLGNRGEVSPQEMDRVCQLSEQAFATMLQECCTELKQKHMTELKRLRKVLEVQGEANPLIRCRIITDDDRSNVLVLIKLLSLVDEFQPICKALEQIKHALTKLKCFSRVATAEDSLSRVIDTINTMQDALRNSPSVSISHLGFFEMAEQNVISLLEQDIAFLKGLGECMELLEHFFVRESRHFQEILFDSEPSLKIGSQHINSLQSLIELVKIFKSTPTSKGLAQFYHECLSRKDELLVFDLRDKAKQLIQTSKEFLDGNYDGRKSAFAILDNSIMVFEIDLLKEDYLAYCLLHSNFEDELNQRGAPRKERVGLDQMKDSKTKVSLYKQSLSIDDTNHSDMMAVLPNSLAKRSDLERINTFEQIIDGVIRIQKALVNICRSGVVYNLSRVLVSLLNRHWVELEPALRLVREDQLSLRIQTQRDPSAPTQKNHFLILAEGLESVEKEVASQLFDTNLQYHNITYLKSPQRIMLCRYLENSDHPEHRFSLRDQEALVLVNYMLSTQKISLEQMQMAKQSPGGEESRKGWTIACLREFISKVSTIVDGFKPKMIQEVNLHRVGHNTATNGQRVQIKYLISDWSQQYSTIFKLVTVYGERKLAHYQIYFGTSKSHSFDFENFLNRAFTDPEKRLYIIIDIELVPHEVLIRILEKCKSLLRKGLGASNPNLYILLTRERDLANRKGDLATTFSESSEFFARENLATVEGENLYSREYLRRLVGIYKVLTSHLAGLGKSTEIMKESLGVHLAPVFLSGDVYSQTECNRLEVIADECQSGAAFNMHIKLDMMDNMLKSCRYLDQFLFSLI